MIVRPASRVALALLLVWQLGSVVAVAQPHAAGSAAAAGVSVGHCARHAPSGGGHPAAGPDAPTTPDCCHHGCDACQCAQMPALPPATLTFGDAPTPDPLPVLRTAARIEVGGCQFFRPPI